MIKRCFAALVALFFIATTYPVGETSRRTHNRDRRYAYAHVFSPGDGNTPTIVVPRIRYVQSDESSRSSNGFSVPDLETVYSIHRETPVYPEAPAPQKRDNSTLLEIVRLLATKSLLQQADALAKALEQEAKQRAKDKWNWDSDDVVTQPAQNGIEGKWSWD